MVGPDRLQDGAPLLGGRLEQCGMEHVQRPEPDAEPVQGLSVALFQGRDGADERPARENAAGSVSIARARERRTSSSGRLPPRRASSTHGDCGRSAIDPCLEPGAKPARRAAESWSSARLVRRARAATVRPPAARGHCRSIRPQPGRRPRSPARRSGPELRSATWRDGRARRPGARQRRGAGACRRAER